MRKDVREFIRRLEAARRTLAPPQPARDLADLEREFSNAEGLRAISDEVGSWQF